MWKCGVASHWLHQLSVGAQPLHQNAGGVNVMPHRGDLTDHVRRWEIPGAGTTFTLPPPHPGRRAFVGFGDPKWHFQSPQHILVILSAFTTPGGLWPNYTPGTGGFCVFWRPKFQSPHISPRWVWWGFTPTPAVTEYCVMWQLNSRHKAQHGSPAVQTPHSGSPIMRHVQACISYNLSTRKAAAP